MINTVSMGYDDDRGDIAASRIPDEVKRQLMAAQLLQKLGQDQSPVYSPALGWGRVAAAGLGGVLEGITEKREAAAQADYLKTLKDAGGVSSIPEAKTGPGLGGMIAALFGGGGEKPAEAPAEVASTGAAPPQAYAAVLDPASKAISSIESGGKYDALGPVIEKTGDRAYGKYQVMGENIPQWTKAHFGQELTPEQFLANPQAQEAVFKGQFGQYAQKYGPEGAARAWFAGEGGMNNPNARDPLGTTVANYSAKFVAGGGAQPPAAGSPDSAPVQVAQAAPQGQPQAGAFPDPARRIEALKAVAGNPRATNQERMWAIQQLQPEYEFKEGKDGTLYALDKRNPSAGLRPVGTLPIEKFTQTTTPEGVAAQKSSISGELKTVPQKESSQSDVEYALKNWQALKLPNPASTDPKDVSFWRDYSAKRLGGAGVNVNVENKAEGAEASERGKGAAKRLNDIADDGQAASTDIAQLGRLRSLMTAVDPGSRTALLEGIRATTGIALDKNTDNVQAAKAMVEYMVPRMRVAGTGASSDRDMNSFRASLPTLLATPGGNELVMDTLQGMLEYRKARADIAANYQVGEISAKDAQKQMNELPDPFARFKEVTSKADKPAESAQPAAPAKIGSKSEYDALPSGREFIAPDGSLRRKP